MSLKQNQLDSEENNINLSTVNASQFIKDDSTYLHQEKSMSQDLNLSQNEALKNDKILSPEFNT